MKKTIKAVVVVVMAWAMLFYPPGFAQPIEPLLVLCAEDGCKIVIAYWWREGEIIENGFVCVFEPVVACGPHSVIYYCEDNNCPPAVPIWEMPR